MTDVFISYARADHEIAEKVFRILNAEGLSVWMDREIHGGAEYAKDIEASLSRAKAVVVIWSESSVESNWVKDEAASGRDAGKLIPVRIDDVTAPLGFRQFQTIDISASAKDPGMRALIDSVRLKVGQDVSSSAPQENHRRP
ncbi:MAG: toll/interleukin-1 receptor domain-containing protein, partial [Pseudomonadota bacterium]